MAVSMKAFERWLSLHGHSFVGQWVALRGIGDLGVSVVDHGHDRKSINQRLDDNNISREGLLFHKIPDPSKPHVPPIAEEHFKALLEPYIEMLDKARDEVAAEYRQFNPGVTKSNLDGIIRGLTRARNILTEGKDDGY